MLFACLRFISCPRFSSPSPSPRAWAPFRASVDNCHCAAGQQRRTAVVSSLSAKAPGQWTKLLSSRTTTTPSQLLRPLAHAHAHAYAHARSHPHVHPLDFFLTHFPFFSPSLQSLVSSPFPGLQGAAPCSNCAHPIGSLVAAAGPYYS